MRNVSGKSRREKSKHNFLFFFSENRAVQNNEEKSGTAGQAAEYNIIRRMRAACWIIKAGDTRTEYVMLIPVPLERKLRERASVLRVYVHSIEIAYSMTTDECL
jgi:hypothetical protein